MMVNRRSAEDFTVSRNSRCSSLKVVLRASSVMPRMPFIGVRISWLMLARNWLLARLACSAAIIALVNSSCDLAYLTCNIAARTP